MNTCRLIVSWPLIGANRNTERNQWLFPTVQWQTVGCGWRYYHINRLIWRQVSEKYETGFKYVENKNQLYATEWFIVLIICSTCIGHLYVHRQELETICVLLPPILCDALVPSGRRFCSSKTPHPGRIACCSTPYLRPPATEASHTIGGNNTHIVSSSWRWALRCPKHVERIIIAMNHSVASSWFFFSTHMQRCTDKHTSSLLLSVWRLVKYQRVRVTCAVCRRMVERKLKHCMSTVVVDTGSSKVESPVTKHVDVFAAPCV